MRRWPALVLLATASGCSTAPLAGFLDLVHPSKVGRPENVEDPLRSAVPPPPPGAQLQPPGPPISPPPASIDSGFAPRDVPPPPPPERPSSRELPPLTVPNT